MYFVTGYTPCDLCMMRQAEDSFSYVRVLHASPNVRAVDVYANDQLIAGNLRYRRFTPYLKIPSGQYNIRVYHAGTNDNPIINTTAVFKPSTIYTAAAIGMAPQVELYGIPDTRVAVSPSRANIRFVHLSPDAPAVDVFLSDGKTLFRNINYRGITGYISILPGRKKFELRSTGTGDVVLNVPNIILRGGRNYTIYAVGLAGGKPDLQVLIPLDGSTYLIV